MMKTSAKGRDSDIAYDAVAGRLTPSPVARRPTSRRPTRMRCRPRPAASAWDCRSAAPLSKRMAAGYGQRRTNPAALFFAWRCRSATSCQSDVGFGSKTGSDLHRRFRGRASPLRAGYLFLPASNKPDRTSSSVGSNAVSATSVAGKGARVVRRHDFTQK
jgi:hypothetical protein